MQHKIKQLADAMTNAHARELIQHHTKELIFENSHLIVYLDNAAALHQANDKKTDKYLKAGMEKVYGGDITYEFKLEHSRGMHEREKEVPHEIRK